MAKDGGQMGELPNAGDLARVADCCGCDGSRQFLGQYFLVTMVYEVPWAVCIHCMRQYSQTVGCLTSDGSRFLRSNLRRVPPLSNLESIHIADELDAERPREKVPA